MVRARGMPSCSLERFPRAFDATDVLFVGRLNIDNTFIYEGSLLEALAMALWSPVETARICSTSRSTNQALTEPCWPLSGRLRNGVSIRAMVMTAKRTPRDQ
jgi:hypothetical protein